jgi:hypothetical protein
MNNGISNVDVLNNLNNEVNFQFDFLNRKIESVVNIQLFVESTRPSDNMTYSNNFRLIFNTIILVLLFEIFFIFIYSLVAIYILKPVYTDNFLKASAINIEKYEIEYKKRLIEKKIKSIEKLKEILKVKEFLFKNGLYVAYSIFIIAAFLVGFSILINRYHDNLIREGFLIIDIHPFYSSVVFMVCVVLIIICYWVNGPTYRFLVKQWFPYLDIKSKKLKKLSILLGREEKIPVYPD